MGEMLTIESDPSGQRFTMVNGQRRRVVACLKYPGQPDVGQIVGPNAWGESCVVLGATEDGRTAIAVANADDFEGAWG